MKLYATTTSERASKGQGGNNYLKMDIFVEDKISPRFKIVIKEIDDYYNFVLRDKNNILIYQLDIEKGEKQKGEKCDVCGYSDCKNHDCIPL